jgi:serine/threonine-protein kinase
MADVFISYKAEDRRRVQPLVRALQADGYSVWWDEHIGTGDEWRQMIERELEHARCVIVIWSKGSVGPDGHFVRDEASRAQRRHVYVPVLIDPVEPPLGFGESQATSLKGWKGDRSDVRYAAVLAAVQRIVGEPSAAPLEPPGKPVSRRTVLAGGAVATVAVLGAGGWTLLKPTSASAASDSIAILPFANLSGDPAKAYFSDGIAEEIRTALARIGGLTVIGRTSSEAVRNDDAPTAAKKLHVDNILTGSVRQSPSTIRITAELIDGRTGADKWSQDYDRAPGDAIKIQTDIARQVTNALRAALGNVERELTIGGTSNPAAHDQYLKAIAVYQSGHSQSNFEQALRLAGSAIRLDPNYADAYALEAAALVELTGSYAMTSDDFVRGFARAEEAARRAVQLQPGLVAGHLSLARVFNSQLKFDQSLAQFQVAAQTGRSSADFLMEYANFLCQLGSADRALDFARRAVGLDPLNPRALGIQATALFIGGHYPETITTARRILEISPGRAPTLRIIGDALFLLGKPEEAEAEYAKIPADDLFRLTSEAIVAARTGKLDESDRALARIRELYGDAASAQYADIYAQRGESGKAFAALDQALDVRDPGIAWILGDPFLVPIRKDPRFAALVRKLNFPSV